MKDPEKKVVYYSEMSEDFAGTNINTQDIGADFPFINNNPVWRAAGFLLRNLIAIPVFWFIIRILNGAKYINRASLRRVKGGCFLYGNHTHWTDAILSLVVAYPKRAFLLSSPDGVSIPGVKNIVLMLGSIPIPTGISEMGRFIEAVGIRCRDGGLIAVFPEATTWPYYTGVRPFPASSFAYPARLGVPVVAMATTFRKRKGPLSLFLKTPVRTLTFSDPIYPGSDMSVRETRKSLHQQVYDFIKNEVGREGHYEYVRYIKRPDSSVASNL